MSPESIHLVVVAVGVVLILGAAAGLRRYGRDLVDEGNPGAVGAWLDGLTLLFVLVALGLLGLSAGSLPVGGGTVQTVGLRLGFVLLGVGGLFLVSVVLLARAAGGRAPDTRTWWPTERLGRGSAHRPGPE